MKPSWPSAMIMFFFEGSTIVTQALPSYLRLGGEGRMREKQIVY